MNTKITTILLVLIIWGVVNNSAEGGVDERNDVEEDGGSGDYADGDGDGGAKEPNWCELKCEDGSDNLLCLESDVNTYAMNCYNFSLTTTPEQRSEILHWHNEYRNYAVWGDTGLPMATNMRQLVWNEDLELSASFWLLMCVVGSAACRRTREFTYVGQNFNILGSKRINEGFMKGLVLWTEEEYLATNETIASYSLKGDGKWTANFMNLVGAETHSVGCATASFSQAAYLFESVVCNYGPGLQEGFPVYEEGWPCQGCPYNLTCRNESLYPDLCSLEDQELGKSPPIETLAVERAGELLLSSAPVTFTTWSFVLGTLGSTCVYYMNNNPRITTSTLHTFFSVSI